MKIYPSKNFVKCAKSLSKSEKVLLKDKIRLMQSDLRHPSLRTKKFRSIEGLFESSVNMDIRILWTYVEDGILLLKCIHHKDLGKS